MGSLVLYLFGTREKALFFMREVRQAFCLKRAPFSGSTDDCAKHKSAGKTENANACEAKHLARTDSERERAAVAPRGGLIQGEQL